MKRAIWKKVHDATESAVNFLRSRAPNTASDDITSPRAYVKTCRIVFNYNRPRRQIRRHVVDTWDHSLWSYLDSTNLSRIQYIYILDRKQILFYVCWYGT